MTTWEYSRKASLMVVAVQAAGTLAFAACGGSDAGGGKDDPEVAFGVEIRTATPEQVAITYIKLVDTCSAGAARRAFALTLEPEVLEREALESRGGRDETPARARERFDGQGLCDDPNQAPAARVVTRVLDAHPVDNTPLPRDTVLVSLDAGTTPCEGSDSEALAVTKFEGVWKVDVDRTGPLGGQSELLSSGCVQAAE